MKSTRAALVRMHTARGLLTDVGCGRKMQLAGLEEGAWVYTSRVKDSGNPRGGVPGSGFHVPFVGKMAAMMAPLEVAGLTSLMERTTGRREVIVGLIDGPVALDHPDLAVDMIREIPGRRKAGCAVSSSEACMHGTFVAGVLSARRGSVAPAICPSCSLLVRPIFAERDPSEVLGHPNGNNRMPSATPDELAEAILDAVNGGARVLNLSAAIAAPSTRGECNLEAALDYAARRGVLVVAAAGNQATVGSTAITRHPWIIPVVGCDAQGRPTAESNLGSSIGRCGLRAPGEKITSLGAEGKPLTFSGTSTARSLSVTGALALLCSEFPNASTAELKLAITQSSGQVRRSLVPPLLNAWGAYQVMASTCRRRTYHE